MTADIIHFGEAAQRLRDKRGQSAGMSLTVDVDGELHITEYGGRGNVLHDFMMTAEDTLNLLMGLMSDALAAKTRRIQSACKHGKLRPATSRRGAKCIARGMVIGEPNRPARRRMT